MKRSCYVLKEGRGNPALTEGRGDPALTGGWGTTPLLGCYVVVFAVFALLFHGEQV